MPLAAIVDLDLSIGLRISPAYSTLELRLIAFFENRLWNFLWESEDRILRRSMFYTSFYALVQRRVPVLGMPPRSGTAGTMDLTKTILEEPTAPESPPPEYTSRPTELVTGLSLATTPSCRTQGDQQEDRELASCSQTRGTPGQRPVSDEKKGSPDDINWSLAKQGLTLATLASQEAITLPAQSSTLTRQLYLHGLTYLLRSLPQDLSQEELMNLRHAAPPGITMLRNGLESTTGTSTPVKASRKAPSSQDISVFQHLTATIVCYIFLLVQFLLPYIKLFISKCYRWEREHQISKRVFNRSINTVDNLGRKGLEITRTVCQVNDGQLAQAIKDVTLWFLQDVAAGVQQGIAEGIALSAVDRVERNEGRSKGMD